MLEVHRPKTVRSLFAFDELDEGAHITIDGGFERATSVSIYKKVAGKPTHYIGTGGDAIVTTTLHDELVVPLFAYTDLVVEGFPLPAAAMIDQRLEALIESVTFGREELTPQVGPDEVESALHRVFRGKGGRTLHLLDRITLRCGFAFAVLDFAGVLVKRGNEYGMFVDAERVAFVRTEP